MVRVAFAIVASLVAVEGFTTQSSTPHAFTSKRTRALPLHSTLSSSDNFFGGSGDDMPEGMPSSRPLAEESGRQIQREDSRNFVSGDDLHQLRHDVLAMRLELQEARLTKSEDRARELERAMVKAQQVDAEFVYTVSLERMQLAEEQGMFQEAELYKEQAMTAREALPQFNLEGLWVGKYGDHGYEMINVTYQGDTLIAQKVTGTKNVPKGQSTFEVDLSPEVIASQDEVLEAIELGEGAAQQWGCKFLQRFAGKGQVAAEGYHDSQWINGQLIMVNDYFSFAWLPIGHQVFFGRPTPELILKLMKEETKTETGDCSSREYLEKCWEETEHIEDDHEVSEGPFVSICQQDYYHQDGCFE